MNKREIWVVIPAYNEEKSVGQVVRDLKNHGYTNILVVDDSSKDATREEAFSEGAITLRHAINRGQGAALQTGIEYANMHDAKAIVTFDADGQHNPKDIERFARPVLSGRVDIVVGNRFASNSNVPFLKALALKAGAIVVFFFYGILLNDSHNGLRCLSRKASVQLDLRSDRMEHASEIIQWISKKKWRYKELPNTIRYTSYSLATGQSPLAAIGILLRMIRRKLLR